IPVKLKCNPEPRYNYDDYVFDLKQKKQESHKIARERLINKKIKSKKQYDKKEFSEDLDVKDLISLKDKTQKNKLSPLWKGPYEILEILDTENVVIQRGRKKVTVHKNDVKRNKKKVVIKEYQVRKKQ
ncbi:zinc finger BED domain-containing protein 1-like, partial [Aphis craccivora]